MTGSKSAALEEKLLYCHFVLHRSHIKIFRITNLAQKPPSLETLLSVRNLEITKIRWPLVRTSIFSFISRWSPVGLDIY